MRSAVEQLFVGEGDPFVRMRLGNETPATFYHFEITDPDGLEASLNLPPGREMAPIALFDGGGAAYYLTLSVFQAGSLAGGMRACGRCTPTMAPDGRHTCWSSRR